MNKQEIINRPFQQPDSIYNNAISHIEYLRIKWKYEDKSGLLDMSQMSEQEVDFLHQWLKYKEKVLNRNVFELKIINTNDKILKNIYEKSVYRYTNDDEFCCVIDKTVLDPQEKVHLTKLTNGLY